MGRKKTVPFIDKKRSSTFHLLHRSQRDVSEHVFYNNEDGEDGDNDASSNSNNVTSSGMVLWPSPHNSAETNRAVLLSDTNRPPRGSKDGDESSETPSASALSKSTSTSNRMKEWRLKLQQAGLLENEDERAEKYVKEISGQGIFLHANGRVAASASAANNVVNVEDTDVLEVNKTVLDSIPLTEAIDEDIQALLFSEDVDFDEYEDLNDEFILDAAQEPIDDGDASGASSAAAFDYDAHVQKLMEKARRERDFGAATALGGGDARAGASDHAFFSKLQPLHERQEDDDDDDSFANIPDGHDDDDQYSTQLMDTTAMGVVPALSPDEERALCEKFAETLAEYDDSDDEYEDMEGADEGENGMGRGGAQQGGLPLQGNPLVEAALDEFLVQLQHLDQDDNLMVPKTEQDSSSLQAKKRGGSGYSVLQGKHMVRDCPWSTSEKNNHQNPAMYNEQQAESVQQVLAHATSRLAEPIVKPPAEEIFIDGKSYFSERQRNPWDCESILSTYSNLDNNPVTIDASASTSRRRQQQRQNNKNVAQQPEEEEAQIRLSNKTGLPLGVFPQRNQHDDGNDYSDDDDSDNGDDTMISVNKGLARIKDESAEEKKARKAAIKRERQVARVQKKVTRQVFQTEFARRTADVTAGDTTGKSVFRYS